MQQKRTDLPFKISESTIVIVKDLPVVQCPQCSEYLIPDPVMTKVGKMLTSANKGAELEIVRYAAWNQKTEPRRPLRPQR